MIDPSTIEVLKLLSDWSFTLPVAAIIVAISLFRLIKNTAAKDREIDLHKAEIRTQAILIERQEGTE